jgi:hypothetical protein
MEVEARRTGICGAVHDNRHDRRRRWRRMSPVRYRYRKERWDRPCLLLRGRERGGPWRRDRRPGRGGVVWAFGGCALGSAGTSYPMSSYRGAYRALFCTALARLRLAIYPTM